MFCGNCGTKNEDTAKFCGNCGEPLYTDEKENSFSKEEKRPKKRKKWLLIVGILILLLAVLAAIWFVFRNQKSVKLYDNYIAEAEKYLEELDYERAEDFYLKAIEIDERQREPYIELAKLYVEQGEYDKAEEIIEKADEAGAKETKETQKEEEEILELIKVYRRMEEMVIPENALKWNENYYAVFDHCQTWEEAVEYCESLGGHLAVITSEEENEALFRYLLECGYESAYFGLSDEMEEGKWVWINGEEAEYSNWNSGEPNGENPNEDYAMFYYKFENGTWNDGDFGNHTVNSGNTIICEWE